MKFLIKDLKLEVIATFQDNEQDMFQITKIYADDLKSETNLLNSIKEQLKRSSDDLVKLSLCWICKNIKPYAKTRLSNLLLKRMESISSDHGLSI